MNPAELDVIRAQIQRLSDRLDTIDTRITLISTELANQLSELSGDIDAMGDSQPPTEQAVRENCDAQTRLANEQARYQIAFRQDLVDLADRFFVGRSYAEVHTDGQTKAASGVRATGLLHPASWRSTIRRWMGRYN